MEAILIYALQIILAAILGVSGYKGGSYAINKFKGKKEAQPEVSSETCFLKHKSLDDKLEDIKEDIKEIKTSIDKALDIRIELIGVKSDLREDIKDEVDTHEERYHKVA